MKMCYFLPYSHRKNEKEVELDLSNYATKSDLKNEIGGIHHNLLKKVNYGTKNQSLIN